MPFAFPFTSGRVSPRPDKAERQEIERAGFLQDRKVCSFVMTGAPTVAERFMREPATMVLSRRDAKRVLDAIMNSLPVNNSLGKALDEHGRRSVCR